MYNYNRKHLLGLLGCFIAGIFFFFVRWEFIVFRLPFRSTSIGQESQLIIKKKTQLYYWYQDHWHTETEELIWTEKKSTNIQTLINALLRLLEQEHVLRKRITVESVAETVSDQEYYISFDGNPLDKEWTTLQTWMFIESLLCTIRKNEIPMAEVYFLIRHQPLHDARLDFSCPWPVQGFLPDVVSEK